MRSSCVYSAFGLGLFGKRDFDRGALARVLCLVNKYHLLPGFSLLICKMGIEPTFPLRWPA